LCQGLRARQRDGAEHQTGSTFLASPLSSLSFSTSDPDRYAWLEAIRIALRIETQPQRIAIMIADSTLGLPVCPGMC